MGPEDDFAESEKLEGFMSCLQQSNIKLPQKYIIKTNISRENGYDAFLKAVEFEQPPEGFFITSSLLAAGFVEAVKMGGYHIPGDFSLVSYGDSLISSIISPSLTVIAEPLSNLGEIAAEYLIDLINDKQLDTMINVLQPVIKVRDSSLPQFKK